MSGEKTHIKARSVAVAAIERHLRACLDIARIRGLAYVIIALVLEEDDDLRRVARKEDERRVDEGGARVLVKILVGLSVDEQIPVGCAFMRHAYGVDRVPSSIMRTWRGPEALIDNAGTPRREFLSLSASGETRMRKKGREGRCPLT